MFKKYRCRYFDCRGRPLSPPCSQGNSCRFVHPEDSNWPGLKPVDKRIDPVPPTPRRVSESMTWGNTRFSPKRKSGSPQRSSERRSVPLVSQNDLFQQCKIETGEPTYEGQRHKVRYGEDRNRGKEVKSIRASSSKPEARPVAEHVPGICSYQSLSAEKNVGSSNHVENQDVGVFRSSSPSFGGLKDRNVDPSSESKSSLVLVNGLGFHRTNERANRVLDLFRDLSRHCHQATQDLEIQAKEEKKLKAYTELASTLSGVSATAANPVMPALADIILKHAQCKQRAEDNLKSMGKVWAEAFDTFLIEISHAMDAKLEAAVRTIRQEADNLHDIMRATCSSRSVKRRRSENFRSASSAEDGTVNNAGMETEASFLARDGGTTRERKRRRYLDVAGLVSPESGQKSQIKTDIKSQSDVQSEIQDILSQMKSKIEEQAQSLQRLAKENNELKATLRHQGSSNTFSGIISPQAFVSRPKMK